VQLLRRSEEKKKKIETIAAKYNVSICYARGHNNLKKHMTNIF